MPPESLLDRLIVKYRNRGILVDTDVRRVLTERIGILEEKRRAASAVAGLNHFDKLGLTGSVILAVGTGEFLALTDDVTLAAVLESRGADVIDFNHIRTWAWL